MALTATAMNKTQLFHHMAGLQDRMLDALGSSDVDTYRSYAEAYDATARDNPELMSELDTIAQQKGKEPRRAAAASRALRVSLKDRARSQLGIDIDNLDKDKSLTWYWRNQGADLQEATIIGQAYKAAKASPENITPETTAVVQLADDSENYAKQRAAAGLPIAGGAGEVFRRTKRIADALITENSSGKGVSAIGGSMTAPEAYGVAANISKTAFDIGVPIEEAKNLYSNIITKLTPISVAQPATSAGGPLGQGLQDAAAKTKYADATNMANKMLRYAATRGSGFVTAANALLDKTESATFGTPTAFNSWMERTSAWYERNAAGIDASAVSIAQTAGITGVAQVNEIKEHVALFNAASNKLIDADKADTAVTSLSQKLSIPEETMKQRLVGSALSVGPLGDANSSVAVAKAYGLSYKDMSYDDKAAADAIADSNNKIRALSPDPKLPTAHISAMVKGAADALQAVPAVSVDAKGTLTTGSAVDLARGLEFAASAAAASGKADLATELQKHAQELATRGALRGSVRPNTYESAEAWVEDTVRKIDSPAERAEAKLRLRVSLSGGKPSRSWTPTITVSTGPIFSMEDDRNQRELHVGDTSINIGELYSSTGDYESVLQGAGTDMSERNRLLRNDATKRAAQRGFLTYDAAAGKLRVDTAAVTKARAASNAIAEGVQAPKVTLQDGTIFDLSTRQGVSTLLKHTLGKGSEKLVDGAVAAYNDYRTSEAGWTLALSRNGRDPAAAPVYASLGATDAKQAANNLQILNDLTGGVTTAADKNVQMQLRKLEELSASKAADRAQKDAQFQQTRADKQASGSSRNLMGVYKEKSRQYSKMLDADIPDAAALKQLKGEMEALEAQLF